MKTDKKTRLANMEIIGNHMHKYRSMMMVFCGFIILVAVLLIVFWWFDENSAGELKDIIYLASHIFFLTMSTVMLVFFILNRFHRMSNFVIAILIHVYAFFIIGISTVLCIFDLTLGYSPFVYLLACTLVAGIFIIEPRYYAILCGESLVAIIIAQVINNFNFFAPPYLIENLVSLIVYVGLVILIAYRIYSVTMSEHKAKARLEELTYYDELTHLLNERSYMEEVDKINENIKNGAPRDFAIIMMDVNNLKVTNDAYGHHYGCHLIVHCGELLPSLFTSSKLYHVGGDEFIAIVYDKDYENFGEILKKFDELMTYSKHEYEGYELIFSVARGYAKYQDGDLFKDVFSRADELMYENKKTIKSKYNMKVR